MRNRILLVVGAAATLGFAAYAGQPSRQIVNGHVGQSPDVVGNPQVALRLQQLQSWLDRRPSGMSPETKAEILAEHRKRLTEYKGTEIRPSEGAKDDLLTLQKTMAGTFARANFQPGARLDHFAWCLRPDLVHTGWYGIIQDVARTPQGWMVKIAVSPRLESTRRGGVAFTSDQYIEYYHWGANGLTFLRGEDPPTNRRGSLMFD